MTSLMIIWQMNKTNTKTHEMKWNWAVRARARTHCHCIMHISYRRESEWAWKHSSAHSYHMLIWCSIISEHSGIRLPVSFHRSIVFWLKVIAHAEYKCAKMNQNYNFPYTTDTHSVCTALFMCEWQSIRIRTRTFCNVSIGIVIVFQWKLKQNTHAQRQSLYIVCCAIHILILVLVRKFSENENTI